MYRDFAPYFQDLRTEIALEEGNQNDESSDWSWPDFAWGSLSTESTLLNNVNPKMVLKHMWRFTNFGKRNVDLLDFFRHAFRPHTFTEDPEVADPWDGKLKKEQQMR